MNTEDLLQTALDAMRTHDWVLLFSLGVMLAIWGLRARGAKIPGKLGVFIASNRGAALLNVVVSFAAAVVASLIAHRPLSDSGLWIAALTASVAAAGGWAQLKAILFPPDAPALHAVVLKAMRRKPDAVIVLGLVVGLCGMFVAGCATPGGAALGKCELGMLPQASESTIADVSAIAAAGGDNWESSLTGLGASLLPGQLSCAIEAIVAAWSARKGEPSPERKAALQRLQAYQAAHPAKAKACGLARVM